MSAITADAIDRAMRLLRDNEAPSPYVLCLSPQVVRDIARGLGAPIGPHRKRRGIRGRKRALYAGWRPTFHAGEPIYGFDTHVQTAPLAANEFVWRGFTFNGSERSETSAPRARVLPVPR